MLRGLHLSHLGLSYKRRPPDTARPPINPVRIRCDLLALFGISSFQVMIWGMARSWSRKGVLREAPDVDFVRDVGVAVAVKTPVSCTVVVLLGSTSGLREELLG
jgi:hypothetical protein